ncbi:MAG TPA: DUF4235 domain-containing protein [Candidatus Brachybacterium merdavium]|uniref:DUF4235 domain-containing protein n=1 Tax=Candidatus Brachybacterium merdavium TaxID=2838513 RepID=A0A9D2LCI5_9MICO|nr:DUF4235 domain-containing protein [Candidatus Brachybacterium merdavium]
MGNVLVKISMTIAGLAAAVVGNKLIISLWGAIFGEDAPTAKHAKSTAKETKQRRKEAKKEGQTAQEIAAIRDPSEDQPVWKALLWTLLSGVFLQGMRMLAQRGARVGTEKVAGRRPRPNRG